jgi:hypothetical protein
MADFNVGDTVYYPTAYNGKFKVEKYTVTRVDASGRHCMCRNEVTGKTTQRLSRWIFHTLAEARAYVINDYLIVLQQALDTINSAENYQEELQ